MAFPVKQVLSSIHNRFMILGMFSANRMGSSCVVGMLWELVDR